MIGFVAPFQILDYLDRLKVVKETSGEYHCLCPVCEDGGFKVNKSNGKYQAFKCGCQVKDIREAIRPWSEVKAMQRGLGGFPHERYPKVYPLGLHQEESQTPKRVKPNKQRINHQTPTPASTSEKKINLARLSENQDDSPQPKSETIPLWLQEQGVPPEAVETRYWYSKTQWVSRFEWKNGDGITEKTIRQGSIKSNGLKEWKKGSKDWRAYRLSEAVKHCQDKWVLGVEGEGCVEVARAIALCGITWQGSNWKEKAIIADVTKLIEGGAAGLVYFPDNDSAGVKKAELISSACSAVNLPCLILSPTDVWADMPIKGDLVDFVEAHRHLSTDELIKKLASAIAIAQEKNEQSHFERENAERSANLPSWSQSDIAFWLAEKYRTKLAWNTELQEWYKYSAVTEGIWSVEPIEFVGRLIKSEVEAIATEIAKTSKKRDSPADGFPSAGDCRKKSKKPSYTISFINGVTALLKLDLAVRRWNEAVGLLPMLNGVLNLETKKLLPHSPQNKLTWCLPYNYNILATCEPITEWLLTMCGGDRQLVQLMRAYLLGILTGRTDWQKFIELIGAGGTGKSTFTRLATALVGTENVHTTTLHKLEKSKFESASIAGKRLVLINDSERYASDVTKLKNLTGQDILPYEVKFKQSKGGFHPDALVIVSTNEAIQSNDYTSGLARRRISIPMLNEIKGDRQKNLIEHKNGQMYGDFLPDIPGLLNWVLAMDEKVATEIVKNYEENVPSLLAMKARTLVETNPIADWLDNFVVYDQKAQTNIGVAKRDKDSSSPHWYLDTDKWLYPNYCEYCHNTGSRPVSLRRFVNLLSDLGKNQLGLEIKKERDRYGSYFVGLKIRGENDPSPPLITGNTSVLKDTATHIVINTNPPTSNTNVINRVWKMVMDKVKDVIVTVMDETIDSDECDGCDGIFQKSSNNQIKAKTQVQCSTEKQVDNELEEQIQEKVETPSEYKETDSDGSTIVVGDRVTLDDCPGHWSWASPFTVEEIEGEMVKLEMVGELVDLNRLSKC
jgi:putative DNA primase/helicase